MGPFFQSDGVTDERLKWVERRKTRERVSDAQSCGHTRAFGRGIASLISSVRFIRRRGFPRSPHVSPYLYSHVRLEKHDVIWTVRLNSNRSCALLSGGGDLTIVISPVTLVIPLSSLRPQTPREVITPDSMKLYMKLFILFFFF